MTGAADKGLNTLFTRAVMTAEAVLDGSAEGFEEKLATAQLEAALKMHPGDRLLSGYMGQILVRADKYDEALGWLEQAMSGNEDQGDLAYAFATALYKTGHYDDALPHLIRMLQAYPGDHDCRMMAGFAAFKAGRLDEARELIEEAIGHIDNETFEKEMKVLVLEGLRPKP